jgi:hypothetical protein
MLEYIEQRFYDNEIGDADRAHLKHHLYLTREILNELIDKAG